MEVYPILNRAWSFQHLLWTEAQLQLPRFKQAAKAMMQKPLGRLEFQTCKTAAMRLQTYFCGSCPGCLMKVSGIPTILWKISHDTCFQQIRNERCHEVLRWLESCPVWSENVSRWGRLIGWDIEVMLQGRGALHHVWWDLVVPCQYFVNSGRGFLIFPGSK